SRRCSLTAVTPNAPLESVDGDLERWRSRGRALSTPDGEIWMLDEPGSDAAAAPVLLLHGFPSSAHDFAAALEHLGRRRRIVALDFLGFGLSDKPPGHAYSLFEQADLALLVARAAGIQRAHVWAHDMGTSVTTELLARR